MKGVRYTLLLALIALAFALVFLSTRIVEKCENRVIRAEVSPNAKYKALVFSRNCGPGSEITMNVSILKQKQAFWKGKGNIFIVATGRKAPDWQAAVFAMRINWASNTELVIMHDPSAETRKKVDRYSGIAITYLSGN